MSKEDSLIKKETGVYLKVKGYRVLLKALVIPEKSKGGIIYTDNEKERLQRHYNIGLVLDMGPQAYTPLENFAGEPLCKVGDWIHYSPYERYEEKIGGHLCYFINDDKVSSVIPEEELASVVVELQKN